MARQIGFAPNPVRPCAGCGQTDDHPRHVLWNADLPWHMDCHALAGCEECQGQVAAAGGAKGDDLRTFLTSQEA